MFYSIPDKFQLNGCEIEWNLVLWKQLEFWNLEQYQIIKRINDYTFFLNDSFINSYFTYFFEQIKDLRYEIDELQEKIDDYEFNDNTYYTEDDYETYKEQLNDYEYDKDKIETYINDLIVYVEKYIDKNDYINQYLLLKECILRYL